MAQATATAYAAAISESDSACRSAGEASSGCIHSDTSIRTVVEAQAEAYAQAMATAGNQCGCDHSTTAVSGQIAEIILTVASDAYSEACVEGAPAPPACRSVQLQVEREPFVSELRRTWGSNHRR